MKTFKEVREGFSNGWSGRAVRNMTKYDDLPKELNRVIHVDDNHKLTGVTTKMTGGGKHDKFEDFTGKSKADVDAKLKQIEAQRKSDRTFGDHVMTHIKHGDDQPQIIHNDMQYNQIRAKISQAHENDVDKPAEPAQKSDKIYHKVFFNDKDKAKAEGMKWNPEVKMWYHTDPEKSAKSQFKPI